MYGICQVSVGPWLIFSGNKHASISIGGFWLLREPLAHMTPRVLAMRLVVIAYSKKLCMAAV